MIRLKYIGQESLWNDAAVHLWYAIKVTREPLFLFSQEYLTGDYFIIQTLTAFIYLFIKNVIISGKIVAVFFGLVGITFIYLLGTELRNKFVGLISAALLSFHHLFWFYGVRPLADGPLTAMVIVSLYCMVKLEKEKKLMWGFLTLFSFVGLMSVKKQGVLLFIAFLIYLIVFKRKEAIKNKAILIAWLTPIIFIVLGSLVMGRNFLSSFFRRFLAGAGIHDPGLKAIGHFPWIFSWYILILIIIAFLFVLIYRKKEYYLLCSLSFLYLVYFEVGVHTPEDRYILPLLSIGFLLASFTLDELGNYLSFLIKKKIIVKTLILIFVILVCWNFYQIGDAVISSKTSSYAGHIEAGEWLKENVPDGIPIFAGSPRMVRVFVEREYGGPPDSRGDYGGSVWFLRDVKYLENRSAFEEDLATLAKKSDVYLEIDIWEYTQPSWYYPINQESLDYFMSQGFQLVNVVEREMPTQEGLQKVPVIFILKKEKENAINNNSGL